MVHPGDLVLERLNEQPWRIGMRIERCDRKRKLGSGRVVFARFHERAGDLMPECRRGRFGSADRFGGARRRRRLRNERREKNRRLRGIFS